MADIEMCKGYNCPLRHDCHRFNAKPNKEWQIYYRNIPYDKDKGKCDKYWPIDNFYQDK